jgi:hypothetical protein
MINHQKKDVQNNFNMYNSPMKKELLDNRWPKQALIANSETFLAHANNFELI